MRACLCTLEKSRLATGVTAKVNREKGPDQPIPLQADGGRPSEEPLATGGRYNRACSLLLLSRVMGA